MRDVIVAVPLYRNPELVPPLFRSLIESAEDFQKLKARLLVIVDSPDDKPLMDMLHAELPALQAAMTVELHVNEQNIGFIGSINFAFDKAIAEKRDIIILNSDVVVFPGALKEIQDVAYLDHMIGFVSPRSNNATIFSLPNDVSWRFRSVEESYQSFLVVSKHLPRFRYAPTAVGFCMFIKWTMLAEFGKLDPIYGRGYSEENDLVMRANSCGYRAAMANHAFVFHIGEKSFSLTESSKNEREERNYRILLDRFPEYEQAVIREVRSAAAEAERQLATLVPDTNGRVTIAFDWTNIGLYHNGTFEAAREIVKAAARLWADRYNIVVMGNPAAAKFHGIDRLPNVKVVSFHDAKDYAAIIRIGQPFSTSVVSDLAAHAAVVGVYMLDSIALDCLKLDDVGLQDIWQDTFDKADLVLYISKYTQTQFRSRFRIPATTVEVPSLLSLDVADYVPQTASGEGKGCVLVVGNQFPHKHLDATLLKVVELYPQAQVNVLGSTKVSSPNIKVFETGALADEEIDRLYREARVVLFPSHYEGFGFPVMHALARRRPVIVRSMPVNDELRKELGPDNIHCFETTEEMVHSAFAPDMVWREQAAEPGRKQGWDRVVEDLEGGIREAWKRIDYDRLVERFQDIQRAERLASRGSQSISRLRTVGRPFATFFAAGLAFAVLAFSVLLVVRGYTAMPFWDQWAFVGEGAILSKFFEFHNEHRATISKVLFLVDQHAFDSRNIFLFVSIYAIQFIHCAMLYRLGRMAGIAGSIRPKLFLATIVCALFGTQNYENLVWGFQTQFVLVFAAATATFLFFSSYVQKGGRSFLVLAVISAFVATFEMANGILVWPLLILQALYCRVPRKGMALVVIGALVAGLSYAYGKMALQSNPMVLQSNPLLVLGYAFGYLGGYIGQTLWPAIWALYAGTPAERAVVFVGAGLSLSIVWSAAVYSLWRSTTRLSPSTVGLACIFVFVAGTALVTAVGRAGFGIEQGFTSRYAIGGAVALVSVVGLIFLAMPHSRRPLFRFAFQVGLVLFLLLVALVQPVYIAIADSRRNGLERAALALLTGVRDEEALKFAYIDPEIVLRGSEYFRQRKRSIFAEERATMLGQKLLPIPNYCGVQIDGAQPVANGILLRGKSYLNPFRLRPPRILIVDGRGEIVGLGYVDLRMNLREIRNRTASWEAFVRPGAAGPFEAISATGSCSRLSIAKS